MSDQERLVEAALLDLLTNADGETDRTWREAHVTADVEPLFDDDDMDDPVKAVHTFEDEGVLTTNRGLVLTLVDGSRYHITIVQSR